jgi:uncharacterized membrane protein
MYDWLKLIHILSSVLMVGTGFGSAFYMYMANRSRNVQAQLIVSRLVVKADWWFTTPAIIVQPVSGFGMVYLAGWPMNATWLLWLQVQMRNLAGIAAQTSTALPLIFWRYARYWEMLGYPAFVAMLAIYWLMVTKPV